MTDEGIRSSCEYFFPAVREKTPSLCFVLLSGCDILHHFPSVLSYPVLRAVAISQKHSCGRLLAAPRTQPVWAGSSGGSVLRASPLQSLSIPGRVSRDFLGVNADCLRVNAALW